MRQRPLCIVLFIFFFLFSLFATAQDSKFLDSLQNLYAVATHDTTRILLSNEIAKEYYRSNPDTAIKLAMEGADWSEKIKFDKGKARAYNIAGLGYWTKSDHAAALVYFQKSIPLFLKANDQQGYGLTLNNIGLIYYYQSDNAQALEYCQKALSILEPTKNAEDIALVLNNFGLNYEAQGNPDLALTYYQRALKLYTSANLKIGVGQSLTNIGYIYFYKENYALALEYQQRAVHIQKEVNDPSTMTSSLICIAEIYQRLKQYDKSIEYAQLALATARKIKTTFDAKEASRVLYQTYKIQKNFPKALEYFELYKTFNDSIFSVEKSKAIATLESKVELEKKQLEIEVLGTEKEFQKKISYLIIAGLIGVVLFTFYILWNRKKIKTAYDKLEVVNNNLQEVKEEIEKQAGMLRQNNQAKDKIFSIVSHDLRSPLNSLKALFTMLEKDNLSNEEFKSLVPDIGRRINHATDITEEILHWSRGQMDVIDINPVEFDLLTVLEKKIERFKPQADDKRITLHIKELSDRYRVVADVDMIKTILRNLISNSLKFCNAGDKVTLGAVSENNIVKVSVSDTGVGIKPEHLPEIFSGQGFTTFGTAHEKGTGLGLMLCKDFIEKNGGTISVQSEVGKGTTFYFTIPMAESNG